MAPALVSHVSSECMKSLPFRMLLQPIFAHGKGAPGYLSERGGARYELVATLDRYIEWRSTKASNRRNIVADALFELHVSTSTALQSYKDWP